ncbi:MAG: hypothetical protein HW384_2123 [Dehalococcoidia bacterium]|nr:hypothetical protein [Dehalococcoidia bacterium]MBF8304215.1 hypothetical protein [Dehalococcoidia bacterium]
MHKIVSVKPLASYKVKVVFSDGIEGVIDLSDLVGKGVFSVWKDPKQFARVFIDPETHTLAWPGEIDLCPDTLYEEVTKIKVS